MVTWCIHLMIIQKSIDPPWNDFGFQGFHCLICCSTTYSCQCIADNINQGTCKIWHRSSCGCNFPGVPKRLFNSLYILQIMENQVVVKFINIFVTACSSHWHELHVFPLKIFHCCIIQRTLNIVELSMSEQTVQAETASSGKIISCWWFYLTMQFL